MEVPNEQLLQNTEVDLSHTHLLLENMSHLDDTMELHTIQLTEDDLVDHLDLDLGDINLHSSFLGGDPSVDMLDYADGFGSNLLQDDQDGTYSVFHFRIPLRFIIVVHDVHGLPGPSN